MLVVNYVSLEIKIIAVKHSLIGMESLNQSAARFDVSRSTLQNMKCLALGWKTSLLRGDQVRSGRSLFVRADE